MIIEIEKEDEIQEAAKKIITTYGQRFYAFSGEMGIGKTTLIRHMLDSLGVEEFEGSPTFAIVQSYGSATPIYHLDCFRIENQTEAFEIGIEELFSESAYFFVEWPEKIISFLPNDVIWVYIRKADHTEKRIIHIAHDNQS